MPSYKNSLTIQEGLSQFFTYYNLDPKADELPVFKLKFFGFLNVPFPNIKNRKEAVNFHDIHHVLTEYSGGWKGEAEIGAWEIASGCGKFYAAWLLNFGSITYGIFLFPRCVFKAFIKGRHSKNFYHGVKYDDTLLSTNIGDARNRLKINCELNRVNIQDLLAFSFWVLLCLITTLCGFFFLYRITDFLFF